MKYMNYIDIPDVETHQKDLINFRNTRNDFVGSIKIN